MKARASFTAAQVDQLLKPINPRRVLTANGHAHLAQQDVTAHLIRVFGFGGYDVEVKELECIFEHNRILDDGKPSKRWDIGYRAVVRLTVRNPDGELVTVVEEGSTATAENQKLGDGHDLALKSAISLAKKRCAKELGDQFGLSLYNKGQLTAIVGGTLVKPPAEDEPERADLQEHATEQLADGEDVPVRDINDDAPAGGLAGALHDRGKG